MTTEQRLADLKRELAWLELAAWTQPGEAFKWFQRAAIVKRQIKLIERNRGTSVSEPNQ